MALPFIILGVAAAATAFGGKKAYDGYQTKSEANDLLERAQRRFEARKDTFDDANDVSSEKLACLGTKELAIGQEFDAFNTIAKALLEKMSQEGHLDITLDIPRHQLNNIEKLAISATEYLGTVVGAGASGAAAGFAVYSGVMAFAAASTGTPIAALSGVAAYNATMAAIGGGSLAAGGWGMAGGAMVLGGAVVAPLVAIAGWAYAAHAEKALDNAQQASRDVSDAVSKMDVAEAHLDKVNHYVDTLYHTLSSLHETFGDYFGPLKAMHQQIMARHESHNTMPIDESKVVLRMIQNGYMLAAIMTDIITTPLFKPVTNNCGEAVIEGNVIQLATDDNGMNVLNTEALDLVLVESETKFSAFPANA